VASALGIDVGTTNVKAVIVGDDGVIAAGAHRELRTERDGDVAEQDADALWAAVREAVREVTATAPSAAADVVAVGVCSQYSSIVPVDAAGHALGPLVVWSDHRGTDHCLAILGEHEESFFTWIEHHGIPPIGGGLSLAHLLHHQLDRPDVHERTAAYLEPMDFVNARLTGRLAATQVTMLTSQLCDNRTVGVTEYDPVLVALSGVDTSRLPSLLGLGDEVGPLLAEVAADLGLPHGSTVYTGVTDTHTGALATGALRAARGGIAIGTTSVVLDTVAAKAEDLEHEVLAMPGVFDDTYLVWAENGIGGAAVAHVLGELLQATDELGAHATDEPFNALDAVLAATQPGAGGVLFLPWLSGSLAPSANALMRGGYLGVSLQTQRRDLVRAAAEGVAHNLAWLLPHVEAFGGAPFAEIVLVGGAARSEPWCQVLADVLDRPVLPAADPQRAVARAVGLLALVRHGTLGRGDLDHLVETAGRFEPDPATRQRYAADQTYFEAAFTALSSLPPRAS
jgi:xylulokinase